MAWILQCILCVYLFQASTQHDSEIEADRSLWEENGANYKPNGSYKILNRFPKPINKRVDPGGFIFPGLTSKSEKDTIPIISDDCKQIGICDDVPNYPEELVASLLQKMGRRNITKFNKDVLDVPKIAERTGSEEEVQELCSSVERIYAPRAAQSIDNEWYYILNDKKRPVQTFRIEICQPRDSSCSSIAFFQTGFRSSCIQKYMLRKMVAVNKKNESVEMPFQVPSCCSCVGIKVD